jgi:hypothetical protein
VLTDFSHKDCACDADVQGLAEGATLLLGFGHDRALAGPATERISFQPHPKTLTMAGDYEYFAAQGRHPFVYALAEFVDNSLRATRSNAPRPREITISLVAAGSGPGARRGLVCITDNGKGMDKRDLNEWVSHQAQRGRRLEGGHARSAAPGGSDVRTPRAEAACRDRLQAVMNYSMEERGAAPQEPDVQGRAAAAPGAGRFLTGDLSYFGVSTQQRRMRAAGWPRSSRPGWICQVRAAEQPQEWGPPTPPHLA